MPSVAERSNATLYPSTTADWVQPESRPAEIDGLIAGVDRYNPANVSELEDYLYDQVKRGTYDFLANMATLKLYQFNPTLLNPDVLLQLLLKALIATPNPDFNLSMAVAGDRAFSVPLSDDDEDEDSQLPLLLPFLTKLHSILRACRFSDFWSTLNGDEEAAVVLRGNSLAEHPLFNSLIRTNVVSRAIASTHQRIPLALAGKWFDLQGAELSAFVTGELGWTVDGDVISIPANEDNNVQGKNIRETVELPQLVKVIGAGAR